MATEEARSKVKEIPIKERYTLRDMSERTGMTVHQVVKIMKDENLKRVTSTVKPLLTEEQREQACMEQTILHDGGNDYKIAHLNKRKLEREGRLPVSITASDKVVVKIESMLLM